MGSIGVSKTHKTMQRILPALLLSTLLTGCIFDLASDNDKYRVELPMTIDNLRDTLRVGDSLIVRAMLKNPAEVVDISRERKPRFNAKIVSNVRILVILWNIKNVSVRNPLGEFIDFGDRTTFFDFDYKKGSIFEAPPSTEMVAVNDRFECDLTIRCLKPGTYGLRLQEEFIIINRNNERHEGHVYPYWTNQQLNHYMHPDLYKSGFENYWVFFHVK
jgi:hypothetical protein